MDPIQIPENVADLSEAELAELEVAITTRAGQIAEDGDLTEENITELESLADALDIIRERQTEIAADHDEKAAKRDELLGRIKTAADKAPIAPEAEAAEASEPTPTAEAAEAEVEHITEEAPVAEAEAAEAVAVPTAAEIGEAVAASLGDALKEFAAAVRGSDSGASMADLRPAGAAPVRPAGVSPTGPQVRATRLAKGVEPGHVFNDLSEVAEQILDRYLSFGAEQGRIPSGVEGEFHAVAQIQADRDPSKMLTGDVERDYGIIRVTQQEFASLVASGDNALVASSCAPFAPIYSFFRLATPQNPVESALPVLQAPRGGIRYIVPPSYADAAGGIGHRTSAQDANAQTADLPYVEATCPSVQDAAIEMVTRRVRWKNLNYRAFPEQVEAFTQDLMVQFTKKKEITYLDAIQTGSTAAAGVERYGASRSLMWDLHASAVQYRKRQNMNTDAVLQVALPDWVPAALRRDIANSSARVEEWEITDALITAMFRNLGLAPTFYYYGPTNAAAQTFAGAIANGAIADFPTSASWFMWAPGTFVRLDGGTLDVGPVRDSALNGSNQLELFAEEWTRVVKVGIESIAGTSTVKASGSLPPAAAALIPAAA